MLVFVILLLSIVVTILDSVLRCIGKYDSWRTWLFNNGLSVGVFQISYFTTGLNRFFVRLSLVFRKSQWSTWFSCGVIVSLVLAVIATALLSILVVNTLLGRATGNGEAFVTPAIPGVNMATSEWFIFAFALLITGFIHEAGHAVAANCENVRVNGFGVFLFLVYPGAFVDLNAESLRCINAVRQLRVYCAGIWHNLITAVICVGLVYILPGMLLLGYSLESGVVILGVHPTSPVANRLHVGEQITNVSDCSVVTLEDWKYCVLERPGKPPGNCMHVDLLRVYNKASVSGEKEVLESDPIECCADNVTRTHMCFTFRNRRQQREAACLPARAVTERSVCRKRSDCGHVDHTCVYPSLDNTTRLLPIIRRHRMPLLYLGHPEDLYFSVKVSQYIPRAPEMQVNFPYYAETLLKYLIASSVGLALFNVMPCYALDGKFILGAVMEYFLDYHVADARWMYLQNAILVAGTLLVVANVGLAFFSVLPLSDIAKLFVSSQHQVSAGDI